MATHQSVPSAVLHGLGGRMFIALWGGLALVLVGRAIGLGAWLSTGGVIALAGACSLGLRALASIVVAITGWLVVDGFVEHGYGELGLDLRLVLVLAATIGLTLTVSTLTRKAAL